MNLRSFFNARGMTLLEVIMALAIFAASVTTLLSATGSQLNAVSDDEKLTQAVFLAQSKMSSIEADIAAGLAKNKFPDEVEKSGHFEDPFGDYNWDYVIRKVELPAIPGSDQANGFAMRFVKSLMDDVSKKLREIKLTIWWGGEFIESDETQKIEITTHIVDMN